MVPLESEIVLVGILVPCCRFGSRLLESAGGGGGGGGGHLPPYQTATAEPALLPEA